ACSTLSRPSRLWRCSLRSQPGQVLRALRWTGYARKRAGQENNTMALQVAELSLELIETLRPLVPRIKAKDKSLADQIMRSAPPAPRFPKRPQRAPPPTSRQRCPLPCGTAHADSQDASRPP